jgi:hypothetical protein
MKTVALWGSILVAAASLVRGATPVWPTFRGPNCSGVAADGRIYVASLPGKLTVIKAGGDKPEILHQVKFGERIHSSPAIAGKNFYLRTQSALYAFGEPAGR